ncbi:RNA-directed DNA polymerase from mobile element jockey [Lucilia cuprina]|nr:RNA-directed DNA polymerase from mobile element jockey [Lucilia cuprina]
MKTNVIFWLLGPKSSLSLENKRYQSKTLRSIVNAPWFVSNFSIHNDLSILKVIDEIKRFSGNYLERLNQHMNPLAISLLDDTEEVRRLKRYHILDLPFRN